MWETNSGLVRLGLCLAGALHGAPREPDRRARWIRGFVHGYLGMPYEVVDGITYETGFTPVVHSPDPYRQGYFAGQQERTSPH